MKHISVLKEEIIYWLEPEKRKRILDGTLGLGGHAKALLEKSKAELVGIDLDRDALKEAEKNLSAFQKRVYLFQGNYVDFEYFLKVVGWSKIDGVILDLGVSSLQLDDPSKGFSFLKPGPLDMRMNKDMGESAFHLVNRASFERLKTIIREYGEEPLAGRIARFIVDRRSKKSIETTLELAKIVEEAYPIKRRRKSRNHPATKTFQALRIAVNKELDSLEYFLKKIVRYLTPGGRIAIISFHSLEDRIVKNFFKQEAKDCICPPEVMICNCQHKATLKILTRKPIVPKDSEKEFNKRSRSAKLRVAERI
ncbi:16S rRNA (cytosine(1402)-N(4))-methyltransferase RsmH [Desulfonauticus submarinus]|uniref:Ribosomal RNA small subunit methyltransferase H n=1 Tax=Desulfonauticus submarinus TaxID=206665 RepID=A0A1H0CUG5_9BACT|nr:16S rRNA (cytosine(1402)-N(4))-methyltransferase RsmH [Desulfonauticus submarinus]SDN61542.1 16S rRNA (cytosine1402-N4)-methyltransferase [Desulfonauticus submarinus]